jgi:hypothetical protein
MSVRCSDESKDVRGEKSKGGNKAAKDQGCGLGDVGWDPRSAAAVG